MGWWKVEGTPDVVGDEVFGLLTDATQAIAELYQKEFGRKPTRSEWQRLLQDSLEAPEGTPSLLHESGRPSANRGVRRRCRIGESYPREYLPGESSPQPFKWMDLSRVNSSLGGQTNAYPIGFRPTSFVVSFE